MNSKHHSSYQTLIEKIKICIVRTRLQLKNEKNREKQFILSGQQEAFYHVLYILQGPQEIYICPICDLPSDICICGYVAEHQSFTHNNE